MINIKLNYSYYIEIIESIKVCEKNEFSLVSNVFLQNVYRNHIFNKYV